MTWSLFGPSFPKRSSTPRLLPSFLIEVNPNNSFDRTSALVFRYFLCGIFEGECPWMGLRLLKYCSCVYFDWVCVLFFLFLLFNSELFSFICLQSTSINIPCSFISCISAWHRVWHLTKTWLSIHFILWTNQLKPASKKKQQILTPTNFITCTNRSLNIQHGLRLKLPGKHTPITHNPPCPIHQSSSTQHHHPTTRPLLYPLARSWTGL